MKIETENAKRQFTDDKCGPTYDKNDIFSFEKPAQVNKVDLKECIYGKKINSVQKD